MIYVVVCKEVLCVHNTWVLVLWCHSPATVHCVRTVMIDDVHNTYVHVRTHSTYVRMYRVCAHGVRAHIHVGFYSSVWCIRQVLISQTTSTMGSLRSCGRCSVKSKEG